MSCSGLRPHCWESSLCSHWRLFRLFSEAGCVQSAAVQRQAMEPHHSRKRLKCCAHGDGASTSGWRSSCGLGGAGSREKGEGQEVRMEEEAHRGNQGLSQHIRNMA